ncbi:hypothetical protein FB446DRAFT_540839 [Lentinula raphanica]|nr:hypothetical protein FB446DRAFT_540839 [Lentinula raphanica]
MIESRTDQPGAYSSPTHSELPHIDDLARCSSTVEDLLGVGLGPTPGYPHLHAFEAKRDAYLIRIAFPKCKALMAHPERCGENPRLDHEARTLVGSVMLNKYPGRQYRVVNRYTHQAISPNIGVQWHMYDPWNNNRYVVQAIEAPDGGPPISRICPYRPGDPEWWPSADLLSPGQRDVDDSSESDSLPREAGGSVWCCTDKA